MLKRLMTPTMIFAGLMFWPILIAHAQAAPATQSGGTVDPEELDQHLDGWGRPVPINDYRPLNWPAETMKSTPAPQHDISGVWEPARGWRNGVQAWGPDNYQMDGRHPLRPFTALGEKVWESHKYMDGLGASPYGQVNDPFKLCDPPGFPRVELQELRAIQVIQLPKRVLVNYQNDQIFRTIWMDGRDFPKTITEPRWFGYSTGKWVDDTTFVVETVGMDERTWIDNIGSPHTADLRVEERFHRVNHDIMELTVTIIDPTLYEKPWNALDKYPMRLQSDSFDIHEMLCSESEAVEYEKHVGDETAAAVKH
jgi:hypothetical protein